MSKIGKLKIQLPPKVDIQVNDGLIVVKGAKGELSWNLPSQINLIKQDNQLTVTRESEAQPIKAAHGLVRSRLANMVQGVSQGYTKVLEISGVGFKAEVKGDHIVLNVGFSHPVVVPIMPGTDIKVNKNEIIISGIDKETVGQMAATIRGVKPPEPYKGKGIKYQNEIIRRKAGKTAKTVKE